MSEECQQEDDPVAMETDAPPARRPGRKWLRRSLLVCVGLALVGYVSVKVWRWAAIPADAPVVGISYDTAWHARARISTKNYEIALTRAGAKVLELDSERDRPDDVLDRIDALMLTGGGDIDPALFGGDPALAHLVDRGRDDFEIALIRGALERDMPILGICRGIQILNVLEGGTLRSLREDPQLSKTHGITLSSMSAHDVEIADGSKLAGILGAGRRPVNSFHGTAVGEVAAGLDVAARSPDGVVEALEFPQHTFVVTTQWHPEVPPAQMDVFHRFTEEASAYRTRRKR